MKHYYVKRARRALGRSWRALRGTPMLEPWFDVRSTLALTYGRTLIHWSKNAMGCPADMEHTEWTSTLRKHGEALLAFAAGDEEDILTPEHPKTRAAQEALRWTADNLLTLWD